ncbi:MAG: branched-chain amino acid ABC transporter permease [Flavobacteriaceae bacterium]
MSIGTVTTSIQTGRGVLLPLRQLVLILATLAVVIYAANSTASMRYALILGIVYAIVIVGNNPITAILGEINIGMSAIMAFGSYAVAYALKIGLPLPVSMLFGVGFTTLSGALLAIPTVRLNGIFTALSTIALAFAVPGLAVALQPFTGGAEGAGLPIDPKLFGVVVGGSSMGMLILCAGLFLIIGLISAWLFNGRVGRLALIVGESPPAATVFGLNVRYTQILVWTWASFVGGVGGVLFALVVGYVSPQQFEPLLSVALLTGGIIGGVRSSTGALLGGILVGTFPLQLQMIVPAAGTGILYGVILFVALLVRGRGIAEGVERVLLRTWAAGARR